MSAGSVIVRTPCPTRHMYITNHSCRHERSWDREWHSRHRNRHPCYQPCCLSYHACVDVAVGDFAMLPGCCTPHTRERVPHLLKREQQQQRAPHPEAASVAQVQVHHAHAEAALLTRLDARQVPGVWKSVGVWGGGKKCERLGFTLSVAGLPRRRFI